MHYRAAKTFVFAAFLFKRLTLTRKDEGNLEVKVNANNIDRALKLLKREVEKEGLFRDLKNKRFYEKPSVKKRRKQREARKRRIKASRYRRAQRKS